MAKNITLMGASYSDVPAVNLPQTGGGTARFDDCSVVTAVASDVAQGKIFVANDGTITTGTASGGDPHGTIWQDGQGYVHLDDESGIALQSKTVNPTESQQTVDADEGYYALDTVTVGAISSSYVGSGVTRRSSSDLTVSGATVTAPAGYYSAQASKSVATGTAGTPTATKGTVSNHAVTVTPSVTNTTGYISGGTKTGTGVTVSASELVSGTKSITANGTGIDVSTYACVDVAVPSSTPTLITKNITANGTYTASSDSADGYSSVTVNVSGGGGTSGIVKGTFSLDSDVKTTTDTVITSVSSLGFEPTGFIFTKDDPTTSGGSIHVLTYSNIDNTLYLRTRSVYNTQNVCLNCAASYTDWTVSATGNLRMLNGDITVRTSSSYFLETGTYTWIAIQ